MTTRETTSARRSAEIQQIDELIFHIDGDDENEHDDGEKHFGFHQHIKNSEKFHALSTPEGSFLAANQQ